MTDYSGAVIQDELHYPWGREWTSAGTVTEERFASLINDATGFYVTAIDEAEAIELRQHAIEPSAPPAIGSSAGRKTR